MRTKPTTKAWLLTLALAGVIYVLIWGIARSYNPDDPDSIVLQMQFPPWGPAVFPAALLLLVILTVPILIRREKRVRRLASVLGSWVLYCPLLGGSLLAILGLVSEMLSPFAAGGLIGFLGLPFDCSHYTDGVAQWIWHGFLQPGGGHAGFRWSQAHFVTAQVLVAVGLAITIVGLAQILRARKEERMATQGLYATVRHPQHLGIALWTFGFALAVGRTSGFMAWFTIVYFYILLAIREERELAHHFAGEYEAYSQGTPFIVPLARTSLPLPRQGTKRVWALIGYYVLGLLIVCLILEAIGVEIVRTR